MESKVQRVASPPPRPLMIWDGDCRFCGVWIRRWEVMTGETVDYATSQSVGNQFPELSTADFAREVYLIMPDGRVHRGAEAVFSALSCAPGKGQGLTLYRYVPGFAKISEWLYRGVANNRSFLSLLTRMFWGDPSVPSTYRFSGMLFLRLLGLVFLVAFVSFWTQSAGLVGDHGLVPVKIYYESIKAQPNLDWRDHLMTAPSLLWLSPDSAGLNAIMGTGVGCSLLVMMGLIPGWALLGCVLTYASLRGGVPIFLNFQWDILLVESGLVALLIAPWGFWQKPMAPREPPAIGRWALWWLLFKLMVMSGLVKLLWNGDWTSAASGWWGWANQMIQLHHPNGFRSFISTITGVPVGYNTWLDGTALQYHYFTQPIPGSTSWWFHNLSHGFQSFSVWTCMAIELLVPFLFFAPRRLRHTAAVLQIFLQIMFMVSGNYGFFNLLTIVLCLPLLDDTFWPAKVRRYIDRGVVKDQPAPSRARQILSRVGFITRAALATFILLVGLTQFHETWQSRTGAPAKTWDKLSDAPFPDRMAIQLQDLGLVSSYGLFRVMTTERPELVIEGSDDGKTWKPYEFVWKPGDPMRQPTFSTPHMPRLDWQMWFAALQVYYNHSMPQWLPILCGQLREGNQNVIGLLDGNPFPQAPAKFIRIVVYVYKFATPEEHAKTGAWWTRTQLGVFTYT